MAVAAQARPETPPRSKRASRPVEYNVLLTATLCLLAAGAVMVYSASSARTLLEGQGDGTTYLVRYLMYGAVGLVALQLLARERARAAAAHHAAAAGPLVRAARRGQGAGHRRLDQRRSALARRRAAAVPAVGAHEARPRPARRRGAGHATGAPADAARCHRPAADRRRRGDPVDRVAAGPRHGARHRLHVLRAAAGRRHAAGAAGAAGVRRRRCSCCCSRSSTRSAPRA